MKQRILQYISDNSITLEQIRNMSAKQFNNAMETEFTKTRIKNILRPIITDMQRVENNSKLQGLKAKAEAWVKTNISQDAEFEFKYRQRKIIIWLDGIPEVIDE